MADTFDKATRSRIMASIRGRDTKPERVIALNLRASGIRFRRQAALPGRPDFYLPDLGVALFVHGCFWHRCRRHYRRPKTNTPYWDRKVWNNGMRDGMARRDLRRRGIEPVIIWEHDLAT